MPRHNSQASLPLVGAAKFKHRVNARLKEVYEQKALDAGPIDPAYRQLIEETGRLTARGGKRLRPYLAYLAYVGYGGRNDKAILDVAVSQELFHAFLLIQDDLIDQDTVRYGGPNIGGRYRQLLKGRVNPPTAAQSADAMALLGGDVNMAIAFDLLLKADFSQAVRLQAVQHLCQTFFEVVGGEVADVWLPLDEAPDESRIETMMRYKTAGYSFAAPMRMGALLAEAKADQVAAIEGVALPLGVAFQIADDILGVFGNPDTTGKPVLTDLRQGKRTLLMARGLAMATPEQRKILVRHLGDPQADEAALGEVQEILEVCGARADIEREVAQRIEQAQAGLTDLTLSAEVTAALTGFIHSLSSRQA